MNAAQAAAPCSNQVHYTSSSSLTPSTHVTCFAHALAPKTRHASLGCNTHKSHKLHRHHPLLRAATRANAISTCAACCLVAHASKTQMQPLRQHIQAHDRARQAPATAVVLCLQSNRLWTQAAMPWQCQTHITHAACKRLGG